VQRIQLKASSALAAILLIAYGAAIFLIAVVNLPQWLQLIAIAILIASLVSYVRKTALLFSPEAAVAIEIASDDSLSIQTARGDWIACEVVDSTYVGSFLTVLNLRELNKRVVRHLIILPDSADGDEFRRLRVWLRWKRGEASS